jgi:hypothetical protein
LDNILGWYSVVLKKGIADRNCCHTSKVFYALVVFPGLLFMMKQCWAFPASMVVKHVQTDATMALQQPFPWDPGGDPYFFSGLDPYWLPTQGWLFGSLQKKSHQLIWLLALVLKKGYVLQFILMSSSCRSFQ